MEKSIHTKRYHEMIALLRQKREMADVTQSELAERLRISQAVVSKIETCERRLDIIEFMAICEAINISFIELLNELHNDQY